MEHLGVHPKRPVSRHANTIQKENTIVEKTINTLSHHFIPSPGFTHSLIRSTLFRNAKTVIINNTILSEI